MEPVKKYDSRNDTLEHINKVINNILFCTSKLNALALKHDRTKLQEPEKSIFDEFTPKLKDVTYGSDEYKSYLNQMQVALKHHYEYNSHHPEFHKNGIKGMNLIQLLEMFCDWLAATKRHKDGNIIESIKKNKERFNYSDELERILLNTVKVFEFYDLIEELFDKSDTVKHSDNVRKIVYDCFHGVSVSTDEYKTKYNEYELYNANSIILTLVSHGLG
jgi:hypothetical protein